MVPKKANHLPKKVSSPGSYWLLKKFTTPIKKTSIKIKKVKKRQIAKNIWKAHQ
jgi:hypothetical protein